MEMYFVLIAGSLPGLLPLFKNGAKKSSHTTSRDGCHLRKLFEGKVKHDIPKLSNLPMQRMKPYPSSNNRGSEGSDENILIGPGCGPNENEGAGLQKC